MGTNATAVLIFISWLAFVGFIGWLSETNAKSISICAEINWQSPTCEKIKQERLKP